MIEVIYTQHLHIPAAAKILFETYYGSLDCAKNYLKGKIKTKESLVALEGNKVVGVLIYARDYSHYANYIQDIAVSKQYRQRGIAMLLMKKCIEISKRETPSKQKYLLSSTDATNKPSIKFHLMCGFKEIGRLKWLHYGKDEVFFAYKLF
ncbi:MAG: GNAT family N-acetyltransferase [Candidatus Woesearchaeota archaeon]|nr:GNAT family N-acetyltransferase [Candidatus Woesearchaeota archaeon]